MDEIGGEFWVSDIRDQCSNFFPAHSLLFLSGRTALDFVIQDILSERSVRTVYLPSYCCHTMIKPFRANGITPVFYDVLFDRAQSLRLIPKDGTECDIVFLMQYFGYAHGQDHEIKRLTEECRHRGQIVIEDVTHSFFSERGRQSAADYVYGSLRKWTGLASGGFAWKSGGHFVHPPPKETNEEFVDLRRRAATVKGQTISDGGKNFLPLFAAAEEVLEERYAGYAADGQSMQAILHLDAHRIARRRRQNATLLMDEVGGRKDMSLLCPMMAPTDVPLFVPLYCHGEFRDELKQYLMARDIFCPVHWPLSPFHEISPSASELYQRVLSLVCDQRYGIAEMRQFCKVLREFRG